jgi:transcription factor TFIIIB component B''
MREIDWVAVRQRQREEDSRPISTKEARDKAEKQLLDQAPQADGPRFQMVDGQIQLVHGSTMVDREAEADREIDNYEVVEERDLTTRITSRSFLKNNKRFPNDFILPGQGKRWTKDLTDLFYEGLEHFGTDFQMISHMFPGSTRRSIKLKFTREERDDPQRVRDALHGSSTIDTHWDSFMQVSTMEEQQFADADAVKREMAEHEAIMREKINAAKAEAEERKYQQREAGVLDEEEDPNNKENGKTKKKRKGKDKQVTFQEEAGVEILGDADADATWGQE